MCGPLVDGQEDEDFKAQRRMPLFQSLGWEDPLEEEMATHSSLLA